jgi:glycerol-3-phosphate O-acyltransferase
MIAADLSPVAVNLLDRSLTWSSTTYSRCRHDEKDSSPCVTCADGSLVYVPCHKSHIDYLILSYCPIRAG